MASNEAKLYQGMCLVCSEKEGKILNCGLALSEMESANLSKAWQSCSVSQVNWVLYLCVVTLSCNCYHSCCPYVSDVLY